MAKNPKGDLIDRSQREGWGKPDFQTRVIGPDHKPIFESDVYIADSLLGSGEGSTKKRAERLAAEAAFTVLEAHDYDLTRATAKDETSSEVVAGDDFEGPWPVFPEVLATSLRIADGRVDARITGADGIDEVRNLALELYKGVLASLGEVVEVDEDEA